MSYVLAWTLLAAAAGALLFVVVALGCTRKHVRLARPLAAAGDLPAISLLKPLKGVEEGLVANLESVFAQTYAGPKEIVFSATDANDKGLMVAREVATRHPEWDVQFVQSDPNFGLNPKVANLAGAKAAARYDLILQSDGNVRLRPDYVERVVGEMQTTGASLLTSMVVGTGERSVGAALENLQLTCFITPAMATALHLAGISCVVGKSMLFRASELDAAGGLESVRDVLAEDFVLGRAYQALGKEVLLSATTIENVNEDINPSQFLGRHSRWLKMRAVIHVGGFVGDLAANPNALAALAFVASGFAPLFGLFWAAIAVTKTVADAYSLRLLRPDHPMKLRYLVLAPIKDTLMGAVWAYSMFSRSVEWRGVKLRFGKDSRLRPDEGNLLQRIMHAAIGVDPGN
ncbi:MAG: glycosyltransferase [Deltaproteobacteria bacterium]|nr:glycosyltransferase [Deltaproteobacteria bacterium]